MPCRRLEPGTRPVLAPAPARRRYRHRHRHWCRNRTSRRGSATHALGPRGAQWFHSCDLANLNPKHYLFEHFFTVPVPKPDASASAPSEAPCLDVTDLTAAMSPAPSHTQRRACVPWLQACPACEETLAAFTHTTGGNGPRGNALDIASREHVKQMEMQVKDVVTAALEKRDNRSRAHGRPPLNKAERGFAHRTAINAMQSLLAQHRVRTSMLLLLLPATVAEQAREAAMRALAGARVSRG